MDEQEFKIEQEKYNKRWEQLRDSPNMPDMIERMKLQVPVRFKKFFEFIKEGDSVLDIGCGDGYFLNVLLKEKKDVVVRGLTISDAEAKDCEKNLGKEERYKGCVVETVYNIPYDDDSFDVVVCSQLLEHLKEEEKAIREMLRVVKDKGFLICSVPIGKNLSSPNHINFYNHYNILELFDKVGNDYKVYRYNKMRHKENPDIFIIATIKNTELDSDDNEDVENE